MARPAFLTLDTEEQPWRSAPMPGANRPIELVRLASVGDTFAMLGRFPAGFARPVAGGYAVAEEFLVLRGGLEVEGTTVRPGTLCFIPAHHVRSPMRSPGGATVLAWFSGPPVFRPAEELRDSPTAAVAMVAVVEAGPGTRLLRTTEADWQVLAPSAFRSVASTVDAVDMALTWWARVGGDARAGLPEGPVLARLPALGDAP
jgi:hypothetical protein